MTRQRLAEFFAPAIVFVAQVLAPFAVVLAMFAAVLMPFVAVAVLALSAAVVVITFPAHLLLLACNRQGFLTSHADGRATYTVGPKGFRAKAG